MFLYFSTFNFISIAQRRTKTHTYVSTYVCYSKDFNLRKIRVTKILLERNNCVNLGAPYLTLIAVYRPRYCIAEL
jgi:hypothetical protein